MNSNAFHNLLNILIALMGLVTALLIYTGCTTLPTGALECSQSWVDPTWTAIAITGMGALKSVINIARDGVGGLLKTQPPVIDGEIVRQVKAMKDKIDKAGA